MKCFLCKTDKLSKEFPREGISENCEHPASCCLRCMISHFQAQELNCPYGECKNTVANATEVLEQCQMELDQLYPPIEALDIKDEDLVTDASHADKVINVTTLAGDMASFPFSPQMTVSKLKEEIQKRMNVAIDKQQLMYRDVVLESFKNQTLMKLEDYNVQPFATVHLMILLYAIPQNFNHVIFDLFWGYPSHGADFLDASCLIFAGKYHTATVDYARRSYNSNAIWHSGDVMDDSKRIGHHTIEVQLKNIPSNVTHLYFTLSAWNSPSIAHYPNPSLKFFEASNKQKDLCKTTFTEARYSQAVIMCSVSRSEGQWSIFESGKLSAGNANNYSPLIKAITELP